MKIKFYFFNNWKDEEYQKYGLIFHLFGITMATIKEAGIEIHVHLLNFEMRIDFIFLRKRQGKDEG